MSVVVVVIVVTNVLRSARVGFLMEAFVSWRLFRLLYSLWLLRSEEIARWHGEPTRVSKARSKWNWYTRGTHLYYSFDKASSIIISRMQGRGIQVKESGFIFALITYRRIATAFFVGSMLLENMLMNKWLQPIGRSPTQWSWLLIFIGTFRSDKKQFHCRAL